MLKIDFGCGYNPQKGYKRCDVTYSPVLDYVYDIKTNRIVDCKDNSVDEIFCRNVLHHVEDLFALFKEFHRVLKIGGVIHIIDANESGYEANKFLDNLWYKSINIRPEIWWSEQYRNFVYFLCKNLVVEEIYEVNEKIVLKIEKKKGE